MPQLLFSTGYPWRSSGTKQSNRPYSKVTIHGPTNAAVDVWALVDTGADYAQFDVSVAKVLGLNLSAGKVTTVTLANGSQSSARLVPGVELTIEGRRVRVDVLFGQTSTPILGRTAIQAAIDFALDNRAWWYA